MSFLELKNVTLKLDDKPILNNLSVEFKEGYIHAVVGPNGAGKSTLAYTIMGLSGYRDIQGDIIYNNEKINNLNPDERARKGITLTWQEPARFEGLSVRSFIASASKDKSDDNLKKILDQVGLDFKTYINRSVDKTLSGGERKKIELASIIAMKPEFVLLDEPDSGIDIASLQKIFEMIKYLKKNNTTVLLVTHSLEVLKQADNAFLMCHGEILNHGPIDEVIPYFQDKCIPCIHKNFPDKKEVNNK